MMQSRRDNQETQATLRTIQRTTTTQNTKGRAPQTPSNTRGKRRFSGDCSTSDTCHVTLVIKAVMGHAVGTDGEVPTTSINMNLISNPHGSLEDKHLQIIILEYGAK
jgi:hypothetical protein